MDDSAVQTAICVIGHPIAGNPSQFCVLRALSALGLDWQCLSFDVPPESLPAAIAGIDVLRFAGALIAAPHHIAAASLVAPPSTTAVPPCPALPCPDWIDGLQRGEDDHWVGCNFLGEAFAQRLQEHEQTIGQPLGHCIYLGDADSLETSLIPYRRHLPASCFVLGQTGLQLWHGPSDGTSPHAVARAVNTPVVRTPAMSVGYVPQSAREPVADGAPTADGIDPAQEPRTTAEPLPSGPLPAAAPQTAELEEPEPAAVEEPLQRPVLLIRPQADWHTGKKGTGKVKGDPLKESVIESVFEQLHPDSLQIDLAPSGASWQQFRGRGDLSPIVVSSLDLEILRIAVAIRVWTGRDADREVLAEAIEEYLEI